MRFAFLVVMKTTKAIITALLTTALLWPALAEARPKPSVKKSFEANKTFGLGVMLGTSSGLAGKYYLSDNTALDFGIGAYDEFRDRDGLQIHADFLWHPVVLASPDAFEFPLYLGLGARYLDHDDFFDDEYYDHEHLGLRAPLGVLIDFNRTPLDIFFEIAVVVDIVTIDDGPGPDPDHRDNEIDGQVGLRYYF